MQGELALTSALLEAQCPRLLVYLLLSMQSKVRMKSGVQEIRPTTNMAQLLGKMSKGIGLQEGFKPILLVSH